MQAKKKPNIVIVMTDHERGDVVLPENPAIKPNVKKMGQEGVVFSQAYCPMAHCCPSRATFFTGLYPSRSGVWNNVCNEQALSSGLKDGVRTFSEDLKDAGYHLAFSGKWHVSVDESPKDRGWEEYFVSSAKGTHHGRSWKQIQDGARLPEGVDRNPGEILRRGYGKDVLYGTTATGNAHDETAFKKGIEAIDTLSRQDAPWGVFIGAIMPHAPYHVPQKYVDMYDLDRIPLPESYADAMTDKPNYYRKLREMRFGQLSEREVRDSIRHFWAMCTYLDDLFGQVLDAVERTGQAENTLILYCSDHGDYNGEHGLFHKGVPAFRGAYHVPAVMRWPNGVVRPGRRVEQLVSLADFAPTFTELAGIRPDATLSGTSLSPFLFDETPQAWRDTMFTQCNGVENYFTQRMAFNQDYKYVFNGFDYDEFYDLRVDPHEMRNRINDPAYDDIKRELSKKMWQFAYQEQDGLATAGGYIMVSTAQWGPEEAFREEATGGVR